MYTGNGRPDPRPSPGAASPRDGGVDGVRGPPDEVLMFPRLPRLELDELLAQLVERAQEVMATQGRLRGLLRANQHDHRRAGPARGAAPHRARRPGSSSAPATPRSACSPRTAGWPSSCTSVCPPQLVDRIGHLPAGQGPARRPDRRPATRSGCREPRRRPPLVGLPARPPADEQLPRRPDPDPRRGVRQPLPHREHPRRVQRRGRGTQDRPSPPPPPP